MEITIKINGQAVSVEVSYEVYEYLCESDRKAENLSHQKRRHWELLHLMVKSSVAQNKTNRDTIQLDFLQKATYAAFPFVITFLSVLFIALLLIGVLLPVGKVLYELGWLISIFQSFGFAPNAIFNIGILTLPAFLNIPIAIIAGVAFFYCGVKLHHVLKKYLNYVSSVKND